MTGPLKSPTGWFPVLGEDDPVIGKGSRSAIAALVERTTRYILLVHLAGNRGAENLWVRLAEVMGTMPEHLRSSVIAVCSPPCTAPGLPRMPVQTTSKNDIEGNRIPS